MCVGFRVGLVQAKRQRFAEIRVRGVALRELMACDVSFRGSYRHEAFLAVRDAASHHLTTSIRSGGRLATSTPGAPAATGSSGTTLVSDWKHSCTAGVGVRTGCGRRCTGSMNVSARSPLSGAPGLPLRGDAAAIRGAELPATARPALSPFTRSGVRAAGDKVGGTAQPMGSVGATWYADDREQRRVPGTEPVPPPRHLAAHQGLVAHAEAALTPASGGAASPRRRCCAGSAGPSEAR